MLQKRNKNDLLTQFLVAVSDLNTDHKLPLISPGLKYNFVRGFGWAYKRRDLYWGRMLISGIKKSFEMSHSSVDRNTFLS